MSSASLDNSNTFLLLLTLQYDMTGKCTSAGGKPKNLPGCLLMDTCATSLYPKDWHFWNASLNKCVKGWTDHQLRVEILGKAKKWCQMDVEIWICKIYADSEVFRVLKSSMWHNFYQARAPRRGEVKTQKCLLNTAFRQKNPSDCILWS